MKRKTRVFLFLNFLSIHYSWKSQIRTTSWQRKWVDMNMWVCCSRLELLIKISLKLYSRFLEELFLVIVSNTFPLLYLFGSCISLIIPLVLASLHVEIQRTNKMFFSVFGQITSEVVWSPKTWWLSLHRCTLFPTIASLLLEQLNLCCLDILVRLNSWL